MSFQDSPTSLHICIDCESEFSIKPHFSESNIVRHCPFCGSELPYVDDTEEE